MAGAKLRFDVECPGEPISDRRSELLKIEVETPRTPEHT